MLDITTLHYIAWTIFLVTWDVICTELFMLHIMPNADLHMGTWTLDDQCGFGGSIMEINSI